MKLAKKVKDAMKVLNVCTQEYLDPDPDRIQGTFKKSLYLERGFSLPNYIKSRPTNHQSLYFHLGYITEEKTRKTTGYNLVHENVF